jgi:hypothetical protein
VNALREAFFYEHLTSAPHDMAVLGLFAVGAVALAAAFLTRAERRPVTAKAPTGRTECEPAVAPG